MSDDLDYVDLLTRYLAYVRHEEGMDYVLHKAPYGYFQSTFSAAERAELQRLSTKAKALVLPEPTDWFAE